MSPVFCARNSSSVWEFLLTEPIFHHHGQQGWCSRPCHDQRASTENSMLVAQNLSQVKHPQKPPWKSPVFGLCYVVNVPCVMAL